MTELLRLEEIRERSQRPECRTTPVQLGLVDFSKPFVPESFTPLFHTPVYARLSRVQQLRYNQLSGIRINEQFMLCEGAIPPSARGRAPPRMRTLDPLPLLLGQVTRETIWYTPERNLLLTVIR